MLLRERWKVKREVYRPQQEQDGGQKVYGEWLLTMMMTDRVRLTFSSPTSPGFELSLAALRQETSNAHSPTALSRLFQAAKYERTLCSSCHDYNLTLLPCRLSPFRCHRMSKQYPLLTV